MYLHGETIFLETQKFFICRRPSHVVGNTRTDQKKGKLQRILVGRAINCKLLEVNPFGKVGACVAAVLF